jgi:hypothetical protein
MIWSDRTQSLLTVFIKMYSSTANEFSATELRYLFITLYRVVLDVVDCYGVGRIVLVFGDSGGRKGRNLLWCHAFDRRRDVTADLTDSTAANSRIWHHFDVAYLRVSGEAH